MKIRLTPYLEYQSKNMSSKSCGAEKDLSNKLVNYKGQNLGKCLFGSPSLLGLRVSLSLSVLKVSLANVKRY